MLLSNQFSPYVSTLAFEVFWSLFEMYSYFGLTCSRFSSQRFVKLLSKPLACVADSPLM